MIIRVVNPENNNEIRFLQFSEYHLLYGKIAPFQKLKIANTESDFEIIGNVSGFYGLTSNSVVTQKGLNQDGLEYVFNNYDEKRIIFKSRLDMISIVKINDVFRIKNNLLEIEIIDGINIYSSKKCYVEQTYETGDIELVIADGEFVPKSLEDIDKPTVLEVMFNFTANATPLIPFYLAPFNISTVEYDVVVDLSLANIILSGNTGILLFNCITKPADINSKAWLKENLDGYNNVLGDYGTLQYSEDDIDVLSVIELNAKVILSNGVFKKYSDDSFTQANNIIVSSLNELLDLYVDNVNENTEVLMSELNQLNLGTNVIESYSNLYEGYAYNSNVTGNSYLIPSNQGKVLLPNVESKVVEIEVLGESVPQIAINGDFDQLTITNLDNGNSITINENCIIDSDGVEPGEAYVSGAPISLINGVNRIQITPLNYTSDITISISYMGAV